ncbi:hypothetical protein MKEN_00748800 [Mycena kentingensis (nom. inval.)]|nr:hypothetical protein MKEN_00748800 [Mycena kentingensis (nom. inval.)]
MLSTTLKDRGSIAEMKKRSAKKAADNKAAILADKAASDKAYKDRVEASVKKAYESALAATVAGSSKAAGSASAQAASEATLRRSTRPNLDPHPGKADMPAPRRTSAAVAADKQLLRSVVSRTTRRDEMEARVVNANNPPTTKVKRVARPRPVREVIPDSEPEPDSEERELSRELDDFGEDSASDDAYRQISETESDDDDNEDGESGEEAAATKKQKKTRPARDGGGDEAQAPTSGRRCQVRKHRAVKKARPTHPSGLRNDWDARRKSSSSSTFVEPEEKAESDYEFATDFYDSDDSEERAALAVKTKASSKVSDASPIFSPSSLALSTTTPLPPIYPPKPTAEAKLTKAKITLAHLKSIDRDAKKLFKNGFTPAYLTFVGESRGWYNAEDGEKVGLWNAVFPKLALYPADHPQQIRVLTKLSDNKVETTRHRYPVVAQRMLTLRFRDMTEAEILADYVANTEGNDRDRPYYWRETDIDENGAVVSKGMFQSEIVARVLAVHCISTSSGGELGPCGFDHTKKSTYPIGALTLSIQAINHAYKRWSTGRYRAIEGPSGNFSKNNYGDHHKIIDGKRVPVLSVTNITRVLDKLTPSQWRRIVAARRGGGGV